MAQAEFYSQASNPAISYASSADFLAGGGEMGERIRSKDWSTTPLGPVEQWPQSLKTIVRIMLTSRQPIWIGWGPELIKLYNDPYKAIVGGKHPEALGQPASVVWREIWDVVGPRLQTVVEKNEGTYDESLLLIMERYGYPEETYYTFSYSPVPGDQVGVGGMICANTDDTQRIIGERQVKLLRTLAAETADARTIEEACRLSATSLEHNPYDLPFAMIYLLDQEKHSVYLAGSTGIAKGHPAAPESVALDTSTLWPFAEVLKKQKVCTVSGLDQLFDDLPTGAWKRLPHQAVAAPIAPSGQTGQAGVLIAGLNPFRLFDENYQGFINLVSGQIAASIANAQAYEEERKRAEALAEIDRAKTLFFSNVSHEFRTPLTLMLGPIEDTLAEKELLSPEQRERTEILHRNALRLLKLVNMLLDFSRIEAGRVQALYEPTDLAALTKDLASNFRSVIEKAGMRLIVDCAPLDEPVYVDREMWEKIVLNLLSNAFKYTLEGEIRVILRRSGNTVELAVQDTGVGIPEEELPHMFERFHRVKGTAGRTIEGTGIGLSLVQELVKLHGGNISITSTYGKGSTFTASLPLGTAHLPQNRIIAERTLASTAVEAQVYVNEALRLLTGQEEEAAIIPDVPLSPGGYQPAEGAEQPTNKEQTVRILFADDNADMREYVSRLLQRRYNVLTVTDGRAALAAVKDFQPDLILTDVMMPQMDGFELLQALRSDPQTRTLPVIMLSARAGEEAKIEGMEAGADDYLTKPFSAKELLARVGAHLEIARIRKEAEERVQAERQKLHDLFMQAPAVIAVLRGPDHVYELANPLYMQIVGPQRDILGKPIREALPELEGQGYYELLDNVYQTGKPFIGNEMMVSVDRTGDGRLEDIYFNFVYQPSYNARGEIDGILVHAVDVTEQVNARKRIEELSQQKDEFIGIASHELKTPVTSLKGYAQLLERRFRGAGDERAAMLFQRMDAQLDKLTALIRDLLDATKIESGKLLFTPSTFDFNELVSETVEEAQRTTNNHHIVMELSTPVTIVADRDRIGQVLTNLLTNAIKYSPSADIINVKTTVTGDAVITSVQDYGMGIPKEKQSHIFERFFRVEGDERSTYPGLGLGLYIAAEFVKRHHGSIWVESEEGKGSTFSFSLPLTPPEAEEV
ncbi:MAG TPA: ATP-binding protein [Ktedonobacteraceae bacterium]|jgi:signal transduction histidine kinase/CheY-like chemotaxis protein|nr:ATP-binding protein [Ktedonobacteraceae bacterium]